MLTFRDLALHFCFFLDLGEIVADGLRQAGGMDCNNLGVIDGEYIIDGLQHVCLTAEYRGTLGKRAGRGGDGLLVMPCQGAAMISAAALGAMAVRQASVDAQSRIHGTDRLAGFGRINGQSLALGDICRCMS